MKTFFILFLSYFVSLQGLYYGSPDLPDASQQGLFFSKEGWFGLKVEYLGDVVLDKSLMVSNKKEAKKIEVFNSYSQQGVLVLNFVNRFEVYGSMGEMKIRVEPRISSLTRNVLETGNRLTWGFGARGVLFNFSNAALGLDFKYQGFDPHLLWGSVDGFPASMTGKEKIHYREWQIGLGLSYEIDMFTPYVGALYNQSKGECSGLFQQEHEFSFNSRKKFGLAAGVCISSGKIFELDLEARMINETAFSASGNFRF